MRKITLEEVNERIKIRFPEEKFEVIEFNGMGQAGKIKCSKCEKIIKINKFSNFFAKNKRYGCVNCNGLWREREKKEKCIKDFYEILDTEIKDTHTYYHVKCKKCGHERNTTLANLMKNLMCGCETKVYRNRTPEEFINEANKYYNNELELIGEYKNQLTKILLRHTPCGMIWSVRPADIIHGRSHCPKCRMIESQGEKTIREILEKNNIVFEQEKNLEGSRQRFDFYLPEYNLAIEYNGRQHYECIEFFHKTQEEFEKDKERDERKKQYCLDNNIGLLIIPYTLKLDEIENIIINTISSTTKVEQVLEKATLPD